MTLYQPQSRRYESACAAHPPRSMFLTESGREARRKRQNWKMRYLGCSASIFDYMWLVLCSPHFHRRVGLWKQLRYEQLTSTQVHMNCSHYCLPDSQCHEILDQSSIDIGGRRIEPIAAFCFDSSWREAKRTQGPVMLLTTPPWPKQEVKVLNRSLACGQILATWSNKWKCEDPTEPGETTCLLIAISNSKR